MGKGMAVRQSSGRRSLDCTNVMRGSSTECSEIRIVCLTDVLSEHWRILRVPERSYANFCWWLLGRYWLLTAVYVPVHVRVAVDRETFS